MKKIILNGKWNFRESSSNKVYEGNVPGTLLGDLLSNTLIEDPYWGTNEYKMEEHLLKDYVYEREFFVTEDFKSLSKKMLVFDGVDTLADIYINDELIGSTKNMHIQYKFDISDFNFKQKNVIKIFFQSPLAYINEKAANSDVFYKATGSILGNNYIRKAHYMFGWDWGPQIPDIGLYRDVYIEAYEQEGIKDLYIEQNHQKDFVELCVKYEISKDDADVSEIEITGEDFSYKSKLSNLDNKINIKIDNPKLWWPNGYGKQNLYTVTVRVLNGVEVKSIKKINIGLRTVTVCTDKDEWGNEFAVVVNGQKIFAMGANFIPEDNLLNRLSPERSERLIEDCALANYNFIRIWGGGYYPPDYFYDICDQYGILIWQDLMFACNVYLLEDDFEENISREATYITNRLKNHASLALWCGNNEMEWGWVDWARIEGHHPKCKADYTKIFDYILPKIVKGIDPNTFYWASSPSSGGDFDNPNDFNRGDNHYWEVWHSNKPFTEYRDFYFRFCSEYGFQSFPNIKTINSFANEEDQNIFSEVMESHQKNRNANVKIFSYVSEYYKYPKDMENIAYISQVLQLKAIQYGVEHWRRNFGRCMGSLYWQLNDCWPVASWASIDYYGRWKALHYGAKRFYSRVMLSACEDVELGTNYDYYLHNESFEKESYTVKIRLFKKDFTTIFEKEVEASINPFEVKNVLNIDYSEYLVGLEKRDIIAEYTLSKNGNIISRGTNLFVKPKHFNYDLPEYTINFDIDNLTINIKTNTFTNFLEIDFEDFDLLLEDNFVDITDENGISIKINKDRIPKDLDLNIIQNKIKLRSIAESF